MGVYTALMSLFFTTNTSSLILTMPSRLYSATGDEFHRKLAERLDDISNDNTVSLTDVPDPDIPSLSYVVFRSNFLVNLLFNMRYVSLYLPKNVSYPIKAMSLPPARQWERCVDFLIKCLLAIHVYGRFSEFPKIPVSSKYHPIIVSHFFIVWSFLAKFLESNCRVSRRVKFVEEVLQGSSGKIIQEIAQAFSVHGDPYHYPIHMKGKIVLKLDMTTPPVLTPQQKKTRSDNTALTKV